MAHPLKRYARHVQRTLNNGRGYQSCLRFVQAHWDEVKALPPAECRVRLVELARQADSSLVATPPQETP